jgi:hypothetical protein
MEELSGPFDVTGLGARVNELIRRDNRSLATIGSPDELLAMEQLPGAQVLAVTTAWVGGRPVRQYWDWRDDAPPAWDYTAKAVGAGYWVQTFPDGVIRVEQGGAVCDYDRATKTLTTNDIEALKWLVRASAYYRLPGVISYPTGIAFSSAADVVELLDFAHIKTVGGGAICFNAEAGVPMFWQDGRTRIIFDCEICFGGALDQAHYPHRLFPSRFQDFYQNYYPRPGVAEGGGPAAIAGVAQLGGNGGLSTPIILSAGGSDILIKPRFTSLTNTGADADAGSFIRNGCVITNGLAGQEPKHVVYEPTFDGVIMGGNAHDAFLHVRGEVIRAGSIGLLSGESGSPANASPHVFYATTDTDGVGAQQGCRALEIGPLKDHGGYFYILDGAHATAKFRGCAFAHVHDIESFNPGGVIQGAADRVLIHDIYAPAIEYAVCTANSGLGLSTAPFHLQDVPSGTPLTTMGGIIRDIDATIIDDVSSTASVFNITTSIANLRCENIKLEIAAWTGAAPILEFGDVGLDVNNLVWKGTLKILTPPAANKTLVRLDATNARRNDIELYLIGFPKDVRYAENVKDTSYDNFATFIFEDGTIKRFFPGCMVEVEETRVFNVALTGTSVTIAAAVADGETLLGVTSTVHVAITGAAGWTLGILAGDVDAFGDKTATAVGSNTTSADYTDAGVAVNKAYNASTSLTVVAKTSNFTGGVLNVCVRVKRYEKTFGNDLGGLA